MVVYYCDFSTTTSKKNGIYANFSRAVFFFHSQKKTGRSVSGEGWRGVYVGTVKKKNYTPLGGNLIKISSNQFKLRNLVQ